ncbi:DUF1616 domain-containing protein [Halomarina salina]|uniref:DUF1616 domain-containing protein n=1 Tax=Halomarina salina TaxID=1872699 RepID=A0ABD5RS50_9EURY|nr:DUF1616 domain-containing protein [Halomarina salina]
MDARLLLPRPVRRLPADLAAIIVLTLVTDLFVLAPVLNETPVRIGLGLVFVLFAPGYAFIAALFPEAGEGPTHTGNAEWNDGAVDEVSEGIDGIERLALSLGTSIAIVPLIGLVLNFTPFGIRLVSIVVSLSAFTLGVSVVGAMRRWALPADERLVIPYREWIAGTRSELFEPDSRGDALLNVVLVLSLLLAVSSVGYAVLVPTQGEQFTELYLLTENESGDLVADDYPTNLTQGQSASLYAGIGNHEGETVDYTLVVELQRVNVTYLENGTAVQPSSNQTNVTNVSVDVREQAELRRFTPSVGSNETWQRNHTFTPPFAGERLRLVYLLYKEDVPENPTTENAYREVHLWANVSGDQSGSN